MTPTISEIGLAISSSFALSTLGDYMGPTALLGVLAWPYAGRPNSPGAENSYFRQVSSSQLLGRSLGRRRFGIMLGAP
jgi:hypothetical protein